MKRIFFEKIKGAMPRFPVSAIVGARQIGKSTLAKEIIAAHPGSIYLDLERPSDVAKLTSPEDYFELHRDKLICIDEIQLYPDLFPVIRAIVDDTDTKFLILGSASPLLLRQSAESLAGRIIYHYLTPFNYQEVKDVADLRKYHFRGGYPDSILVDSDEEAQEWTENYIKTFLERDVSQFGFDIPPEHLRRLWTMLAHLNGQLINYSQLGKSLGVTAPTVRNHVDILRHTFLIRTLPPYHANIKKRLVKQHKVYLRDTGILHYLLGIDSYEDLYSHPAFGNSWEMMVIENVIQSFPKWEPYFYRTSAGAEIDLILTRGRKKIAFEVKTSSNPKVPRGFWTALEDLKIKDAYVIANVKEAFPLKNKVQVIGMQHLEATVAKLKGR